MCTQTSRKIPVSPRRTINRKKLNKPKVLLIVLKATVEKQPEFKLNFFHCSLYPHMLLERLARKKAQVNIFTSKEMIDNLFIKLFSSQATLSISPVGVMLQKMLDFSF